MRKIIFKNKKYDKIKIKRKKIESINTPPLFRLLVIRT